MAMSPAIAMTVLSFLNIVGLLESGRESRHRRALQIRTDGEGARIVPFHFSDGSLKIELTDMAQN